jgi:glucose/arabinose dehydrogenase
MRSAVYVRNTFLKPLSVFILILLVHDFSLAQIPEGFIRQPVATGLNPTSIVSVPDGRIFITEKHGVIRIIRDDQLLTDPFLKIEVDNSNERGLGHMVLHPEFEMNGYYYVFYAVPGMGHNRVSRFTANGDYTIPGSEVVILELDPLGGEIHNGGDMVFGFDGYLYISAGDGGQNWRGEDLGSTNGKVLRIDVDGNPAPDNPWKDLGYLRANLVYAYGFRNPFTMTLNPITGEIYTNDVGGSKYEEVNKVEWGGFYGWPKVEGKRTVEVVPSEYKDPIFQYGHVNNYCAIVGSAFYLPQVQQFPEEYVGRYFYSDYCTGDIRMLDPETGMDKGVFISDGDRVVDLEVSPDGSFYYLERKGLGDGSPEDNTGTNEGILWKVNYTGSGAPFISVQPKSVLHAIGEDAHFSVLASGAVPLTYKWLVNGEDVLDEMSDTLTLEAVSLGQDSTTVQVEISNGDGVIFSDKVYLRVTPNHRPQPSLVSPPSGLTYMAGDTIFFEGSAFDDEDGLLTAEHLSFKIDFHHGTHSHPGLPWTSGISAGEWIIPAVGETSTEVWYRIYMNARDSEGLSNSTYVDVYPKLGNVSIGSDPDHLIIHLDGSPATTPYEIEGVSGISRHITAPYKQVRGDSVFFFSQWADGLVMNNREIKTSSQPQQFTGLFDGMRNGRGTGLTAYYYDNPQFAGTPVATALDSLLDHQFLLKAPYPGLPEDHFGIVWKGYLQPLRSGLYQFTVFADDGVFVEIDGNVIIQQWEPGVHRETGSLYMEQGRLYPIHIRYYEFLYGAQMRFRWSCQDFPEEVVPTSQFYPADFLTDPDSYEVSAWQNITGDQLMLMTNFNREAELRFKITSVLGMDWTVAEQPVSLGDHTLALDISFLPAGWYYLVGMDQKGSVMVKTPFVKVK